MLANNLVTDIVERVLVKRKSGPFTLEFEDDETVVMTSSEEVELWVNSENPEPIVFPSKGLNSGAFRHIPDPDSFVLAV